MSKGIAALVAPPPLASTSRQRRLIAGDRVFAVLAYGAAVLILLIAVIFIIALFIPALPAITRFGLGFFVSQTWDPVRLQFGALPAIYGTLVSSARCRARCARPAWLSAPPTPRRSGRSSCRTPVSASPEPSSCPSGAPWEKRSRSPW